MMNNDAPRATFTFDDALAAISAYALALRNDSTASDSTLDDLQYDLDCMLDHDSAIPFDDDDDDNRLNPDFTTFPSYEFHSLNPELAHSTAIHNLESLRMIANSLFSIRP